MMIYCKGSDFFPRTLWKSKRFCTIHHPRQQSVPSQSSKIQITITFMRSLKKKCAPILVPMLLQHAQTRYEVLDISTSNTSNDALSKFPDSMWNFQHLQYEGESKIHCAPRLTHADGPPGNGAFALWEAWLCKKNLYYYSSWTLFSRCFCLLVSPSLKQNIRQSLRASEHALVSAQMLCLEIACVRAR